MVYNFESVKTLRLMIFYLSQHFLRDFLIIVQISQNLFLILGQLQIIRSQEISLNLKMKILLYFIFKFYPPQR